MSTARNTCPVCNKYVTAPEQDGVRRAVSGFLTLDQVADLDCLASEYRPSAEAHDCCRTCLTTLMASAV